jgi:LysM repeat protein
MTIFHVLSATQRISIHYNLFMRNILPICILLLAACTPSADNAGSLIPPEPYITITPANTNTPNVVIAETPLPTATPFAYVIQQGDTLSELAETFHISQDDLRAANPQLNPNSMTIGMTVLIPNSSSVASGASTPIPVAVPIIQTTCHPTADDGLWCFALIHNDTLDILENVSVQITLTDENGTVVASQPALPPLDILPPHASLPAYVFFPNVPANANIQVQLLSALQLTRNNGLYLPAVLNNTLAQMDGQTARLNGQIHLPSDAQAATQVWVAAVAYDKQGQVIGVKRWEGGAIQPGTSIPFNFVISSLGSAIDTVEFFVEARS